MRVHTHIHTHTHTHTHTRHTQMHNLKISVDHQPQPPLLMFQFDSHQILLRLLLHFILLVHFFDFKFLLVFIGYFPFWLLTANL